MPYNDLLLTDVDRARSILGDIDPDLELLSDAHIDAVITAQGSLMLGVSYLAHELVVRFEQDPVSIKDAGGEYDYSERLTTWRALGAPFRALVSSTAGEDAAGGHHVLSFVPATFTDLTLTDEYGRAWS